jgi:hypothetical protein
MIVQAMFAGGAFAVRPAHGRGRPAHEPLPAATLAQRGLPHVVG